MPHQDVETDGADLAALREEIASLGRRYPEAEKPASEAVTVNAATCPTCRGPMQVGTAIIRGSRFGFLFSGVSHQHLRFKSADGSKAERKVLGSDQSTRAFHCDRCRLTVIRDREGQWPEL